MSNVVRLASAAQERRNMCDEACRWVVRLSVGASDEDVRALHTWLNANPEHVNALLGAARIWDQAAVLEELATVVPLEDYLQERRKRASWFGYVLPVAVTTLVCFLCLQLLPVTRLDMLQPFFEHAVVNLSYETSIGQQSTAVLPDGTEVLLNTGSRIELVFNDRWRHIILRRGEVHFNVVEDKDRPFRVYANGGVVEAVGTAFTVQQNPSDGLEVTVVEGKVTFTKSDQVVSQEELATMDRKKSVAPLAKTARIPLLAGEVLQVDAAGGVTSKKAVPPQEIESRLAWRQGMLLFQGEPLEQVVREVNRYTSIRIDVDAAVRDIKVLGVYPTGNVEGILLSMASNFNVKVVRVSENHIVLKANDEGGVR